MLSLGGFAVLIFANFLGGQAGAEDPRDAQALSNLQEIAFGMVVYHESHTKFPAQASFKDREKLLSWRVHLLPSLGHNKLYKKFHLDEAWDSTHNKSLLGEIPKVYADPRGKADSKAGETRIQVPVGPTCVFTGKPEGVASKDISDGAGKTVVLVEVAADRSVPWTKPDDIEIDTKNPLSGLLEKDQSVLNAAYADGTTQRISSSKVTHAIFTRNAADK